MRNKYKFKTKEKRISQAISWLGLKPKRKPASLYFLGVKRRKI